MEGPNGPEPDQPTRPIDDEHLMLKFKVGLQSFVQYFKDGAWSEILVRVAIFVLLTVLVHTILVWSIYRMIIPMIQMWFVDSALEEAKKRLENVEWKTVFNDLKL